VGNAGFQFDPRQQYQLDAIAAVVDLFDGQPRDADKLAVTMRGTSAEAAEGQLAVDTAQEIGALGNNLVLDEATILANLQAVQDRNGLEQSESLVGGKLDFDIEMETGTGKTYVYLRTIFELAQHYGFGKFIILVPSVAIREGVNTSIRLMREHFRDLYPALPFDAGVYRGDRAEEVQAFATATGVQMLVMTIDSVRGNANTRIIHQTRDRLNGLRPIDYLKATRPVVIMDEPQNMESLLSQSAVGELDPAFTLRYSATHAQLRNLVYRLDPVDAHDLGLVKQIVVDSVAQQGADAAPYLKLVDVTNTRGTFKAKLELSCRAANGSASRATKTVKRDADLATITCNPAYDGWRINGMSIDPVSVELSSHGTLLQGDSIGGSSGAIYKEMIRQTVLEHLRKEAAVRDRGIKVLSLFFVDRVASFLGNGSNNEDANGEFVKWFDEVFAEERNKSEQYRLLLPQEPRALRRAYFSQLKKKGGKVEFQDSSGATKADDDAYELIMQDKQRLLDLYEPVRFIFSHSALREGWDNPNVFQICALREVGTDTERRQTLGRGLRLPVAKTERGYERIADGGIATLTVIANESYAAFADSLQDEYKAAGVAIGQVRPSEFAKLARLDADGKATDELLGYKVSQEIFQHLHGRNYLRDGKTTPMFTPDATDFSLNLPEALKPYETGIIQRIRGAGIGKYVKNAKDRKARKFNKELYASPEFEEFWNAISRRTTYRVQVEREAIVGNAIYAIKREDRINPLRIEVTRAGVRVLRGGTQSQVLGATVASLDSRYDLPDIIGELQQATSLTRQTLVDIVKGSNRLAEFIGNPNDFIAMVLRCIKSELAKLLIDGIQYEKLDGSIYELRELQTDGLEEKERFFDRMIEIHNTQKTDFDHVLYDSEVEREFAEMLDSRADIKLFMKLPAKFKVPTPVGDYNPDWAIIRQTDGENRIYMIRETKSTHDRNKRRPSENARIDAAIEHFKAIGIGYDVTVPPPPTWNL
jgi:type III restriction enzyme